LAKKSLNVSWSKPDDPNGVIRSYNVSWKKIENNDEPGKDLGVNSGSDETEKQSLTNIGNGELGKLWLYRIVEDYPVTKPPQSSFSAEVM
jgi:hypothetical protein